MIVINNGKGVKLDLSYDEAATITVAMQKGAQACRFAGEVDYADKIDALVNRMLNGQEVIAHD